MPSDLNLIDQFDFHMGRIQCSTRCTLEEPSQQGGFSAELFPGVDENKSIRPFRTQELMSQWGEIAPTLKACYKAKYFRVDDLDIVDV